MFCKYCGKPITDDAIFCPSCGAEQNGNTVQPQPIQIQAPAKDKDDDLVKKAIIAAVFSVLIITFALCWFNAVSDSPGEPEQTQSQTVPPKKDFVFLCKEYEYESLYRYSEDYEGKPIKIKGEVSQIIKQFGYTAYTIQTKQEYGFYFDDVFCVYDKRTEDTTRIMEGDLVIVYGTYDGLVTWEYALTGSNVEVPTVSGNYIDFVKD